MKKWLACVLALVLALSCLSLAAAEDYYDVEVSVNKTTLARGESVVLSYNIPNYPGSGLTMTCYATLYVDRDDYSGNSGYSSVNKSLPSQTVNMTGASGTFTYTLPEDDGDYVYLSLELTDANGDYRGSGGASITIRRSAPAGDPATVTFRLNRTTATLGATVTASYTITTRSGVELDRIRFWADTGSGLSYIRDLSEMSGTLSFQVTGTENVRFNIDVQTADGWFCDFYSPSITITGGAKFVGSGWQTADGQRYYGDDDGYAVRGVQQIDGKYYFFDLETCAMVRNQWCSFIDQYYYAGSDGVLFTEKWLDQGGSWYYFDYRGRMLASTVETINGVSYSFGADGALVTDDSLAWKQYAAGWRYERPSGSYAVGWWDFGGTWYYFNKSTGYMFTGWHKIGDDWYYFGNDGVMVTGWQQIGGSWYYFEGGAMATGWKQLGAWYYFDEGAMVTGWKQIDGDWYYFDGGAMVTGWKQIGGSWYYFEGGAMISGWKQLGGAWYYFAGGAMATGWQMIDGQWEFFSPGGTWQYTWTGN